MRILIACEYSGIVRDAFAALGHDAISCDLLRSDAAGKHYQGNVMDIMNDGFDLMIGHPPCTYIANSGVRWLNIVDGQITNMDRKERLYQASVFFKTLLNAPINRICIENPIPHKYAELPKYSQIIQPWQFGHGETKATCLWLKNLPKLIPTNIVEGREGKVWKMPPSANRWKLRSTTYKGIAEAMSQQWNFS